MNQFLNKRKLTGFTLLEIIIAIFFVTMGMGGAFTVIQKSFSILSLSGSRLVAANLAQEGIEVVRNIRDTNWLETQNWDSGLNTGDWEVQYNEGDGNLTVWADLYLNIDEDGFYSYKTSGTYTPTKFKRKITINKITADSMKITVDVIWKERAGKEYTYTAHHLLYDWK
jgi:type II secretory pathway pseudopilin PulG